MFERALRERKVTIICQIMTKIYGHYKLLPNGNNLIKTKIRRRCKHLSGNIITI